MVHHSAPTYSSTPMLRPPHVPETNKRRRASKIFAICLVLLLFFYLLNVLAFFLLLKIAHVISKSFLAFSTFPRDTYSHGNVGVTRWQKEMDSPEPNWSISCDTTHFEYDICYLNRPIVVDPTIATLSAVDPTNSTPLSVIKIRPYPRKGQPEAMERTKELTLTAAPLNTSCAVTHNTPALVFSAGGFTGNVFHDFNEGWVPLFITVEEYFNDRDVILGIVNCSDWWLKKYAQLLPRFSLHPIINLDKETKTHCFPSAIVGLKIHGVMTVDPTLQRGPNPNTMLDFRRLLARAYNPSHAIHASHRLPTFSLDTRPKLAFLNRSDSRRLLNEGEIRQAAEQVGFDVAVFEVKRETPMDELFRLIDSSHAMVGVHGAGLTHELFLRPGAVLVQIVPINCGWLADMCYGKLAIRLGLEYIGYEVRMEESTLQRDEFAMREHLNPHDPASSLMGNLTNWYRYMEQDIKLDVVRFKRYLERAYKKATIFMEKQSLYSQI